MHALRNLTSQTLKWPNMESYGFNDQCQRYGTLQALTDLLSELSQLMLGGEQSGMK